MLWMVKTGISRNSGLPDSVANMLTVPRDGCPRHNARELTHRPFCQSLPGRFQQRRRLAQLLLSSVLATVLTKGVRIMGTLRASGLDEYSGAELVAATNSGDTHAFERLVFRWKRRVVAVAQRITNNRKDAEDVVQDRLIKA